MQYRKSQLLFCNIPVKPPSILQLEVTKNCNFACIMCHKGQSILDGRDFNRNDLSDIARQQIRPVFPYLKKAILFGDGEPMIYKYFWELIEEIRNASPECAIDFINNGSMIHDQNIERLFKYKISSMGLSIGGAKAESHNYCRPPGMFDKIIDNYKNLYNEKQKRNTFEPYIRILMVVMKCNYKEISDLIELAHTLGSYHVELQKLFVTGSAVASEVVKDEDIEPYLKLASDVAKSYKIGFSHYPINSKNQYFSNIIKYKINDPIFRNHFESITDHGYCKYQQPWNTVYVLHDGKVVPDCHWWFSKNNLELNICGTLDEKTDILDIWNGSNYEKIRKKISSGKILPQCRGCGLAGGVIDEYRSEATDHVNPNQEYNVKPSDIPDQTIRNWFIKSLPVI